MIVWNIMHSNLIFTYVLLLISIISSVDSRRHRTEISLTSKLNTTKYKRLAKYCYIEDYSAWLQRQHEFTIWFDLAQMLRLPLNEDAEFQREFELYRLQYQCLRLLERLPISIGPG